MDIDAFFKKEGIDDYAIIRISDLPETNRPSPMSLVPHARSIIVFGREIPSKVNESTP